MPSFRIALEVAYCYKLHIAFAHAPEFEVYCSCCVNVTIRHILEEVLHS